MMRRAWYVWKFFGGRFKGSLRVEQGCDAADRLAARLSKIHGNGGWSYSLSDRQGHRDLPSVLWASRMVPCVRRTRERRSPG